MLDIKRITDETNKIKQGLKNRNCNVDIFEVIELDKQRKDVILESEKLKSERNKQNELISQKKRNKENSDSLLDGMKEISEKIKRLDEIQSNLESKIKEFLLNIPNIPSDETPVGKDDSKNVEVRKHLEPTKFSFEPKPHWDLGEKLNILDFKTAAKISGARFTIYKGLGAKLERAIISFMLDTHTKSGYTEVLTPYMVNRESMTGTGQLPKFEEDAFQVKNNGYFLIPTAEVPVTNMHRDDIIDGKSLPFSYCSYSACFRAEAGSAGRDTRGLIRQHQFNKVELVKFTRPEESYEQLEKLTSDAENILKLLKLPYRVVALCTGDIGFSSAKTYDIEVWMPSYNRYVEISSCSNFEDYQARRANIKYKDDPKGKAQYVHTLNGSGLAVGRTVAAVLENFQDKDGNISVPEVLQKYMDTDIIK